MKIAMLGVRAIPASYGGVERSVESIGTRLARMGHDVTVFCRDPFRVGLCKYDRLNIVTVPTIRQKHLEMPVYAFLSSILTCFRRYDILHIHSVDPVAFSLLRRRAYCLVATSQGQAYRRKKWGLLARSVSRLAERRFLRIVDAPIAVSKTLQRYYEAISHRNILYIPNGAEIVPPLSPAPLQTFNLRAKEYVLFVGRLEPTKGCHIAIEAYRRTGLSIPLVVMGGSTYTNYYVERLKRSAPSSVRFIGHQAGANYWTILQHAKLVVFPTEIEGMSVALLEALGQSLPVIYSDIPENREVAEGAGVSFRCNDPESLAYGIVSLVRNPDYGRCLGELGHRRVEQEFNWDTITFQLDHVYRQSLSSG